VYDTDLCHLLAAAGKNMARMRRGQHALQKTEKIKVELD